MLIHNEDRQYLDKKIIDYQPMLIFYFLVISSRRTVNLTQL
jgi:hypothetical protein